MILNYSNEIIEKQITALHALQCKSVESGFFADIEIAEKTLKMQLAVKPINQGSWKACPTCSQGIGVNNETKNPMAKRYCYHCGQKLDWEVK